MGIDCSDCCVKDDDKCYDEMIDEYVEKEIQKGSIVIEKKYKPRRRYKIKRDISRRKRLNNMDKFRDRHIYLSSSDSDSVELGIYY